MTIICKKCGHDKGKAVLICDNCGFMEEVMESLEIGRILAYIFMTSLMGAMAFYGILSDEVQGWWLFLGAGLASVLAFMMLFKLR